MTLMIYYLILFKIQTILSLQITVSLQNFTIPKRPCEELRVRCLVLRAQRMSTWVSGGAAHRGPECDANAQTLLVPTEDTITCPWWQKADDNRHKQHLPSSRSVVSTLNILIFISLTSQWGKDCRHPPFDRWRKWRLVWTINFPQPPVRKKLYRN